MIHMRAFNDFEIENFRVLANLGIKYTTFQTYKTALDKSYFDAIAPIRAYFVEEKIHDYAAQGQGIPNKEYREGFILTESLFVPAKASLYRPLTKKGDPRLWFSRLNRYANPDDIFALFHMDTTLYVINVTQMNIRQCMDSVDMNPIKEVLSELQGQGLSVAYELLEN